MMEGLEHLDFNAEPEKSAAATLEDIRNGGARLVAMSTSRLRETITAIEEGRFMDAFRLGSEALAKLQPIADAQHYVGGWEKIDVIRAKDVEVGTVFYNGLKVAEKDVEQRDCAHDPPHVTIKLKFDNGSEAALAGEEEVTVRVATGE
jgi:hypothetical protein